MYPVQCLEVHDPVQCGQGHEVCNLKVLCGLVHEVCTLYNVVMVMRYVPCTMGMSRS